jgi:hypothetical protein
MNINLESKNILINLEKSLFDKFKSIFEKN